MLKHVFQFALFASLLLFCVSNLNAQGGQGGGGNTGGNTNAGGETGGNLGGDTGNNLGGDTTGGGGSASSNVSGNDGIVGDEPNVEIELSDDIRNQGFVGVTAPLIQDGRETEMTSAFQRNAGFIGAASDTSGPPVVDNGTFGGGVNDVNGTFNGSGGGRGGAVGANEVGFRVTKGTISIRAKLRPNFYAPRPAPQFVASRFNDHLALQPGSRSMSGSYKITIQNRTAYISGTVASSYESQRLERQLKLEPGVYQIVNQLQITN